MLPQTELLPQNSALNYNNRWIINLRRFYYVVLIFAIGIALYKFTPFAFVIGIFLAIILIPLYLFGCVSHILSPRNCNMGFSNEHSIVTLPHTFATTLGHYFLPIICGLIFSILLAIKTSHTSSTPSRNESFLILFPLIFIGFIFLFGLIIFTV